MSDIIIPGLVAVAGGALGGGVLLHESREQAAMRASRTRLRITFPAGVDPQQARAALAGIAGTDYRLEYIFEVEATVEGIRHYLRIPEAARASVVSTLAGAMPGLRASEASEPSGRVTAAATVFLPTPAVLSTEQPESATRTMLSGIAGLAPGERAVLRLALRASAPRTYAPKEPMDRATRQIERAWRQKVASGAGFRVAGLVLVRAHSVARARELCEHLTSSLRSRRGPVGMLRVTTERGSRSLGSLPRTTRSSGWVTASEALGLLAWPVGEQPVPGVEVGSARQLVVPRHVPRSGRRLLVGRDSSGSLRPVALSHEAARLHLGLFGSTGSGKTTVLIRLILDALAEGVGGVFADPKDAIPTLLDQVPAEHADRVIVLDPAAPGPVPGLDLFGAGDPVLRSDVILSVLKGVSEGWGPRIQRFLSLGLRSLAVLPDAVLYDWLRLYTEPSLRRQVIGRITDPIITAEWRAFEEAMSPAEQMAFTAPVIARVTELLSRPAIRAVLSQPRPMLNLDRLLAEGRWLCVSLSPGTLGEQAAHLLASVTSYLLWSAVEKRAALPPAQRRQVMFVLDEAQSLSDLPVGLEVFFERTRSLNCAVVAATQAASRLPETTRQALLANVGSLLTFRGGADESQRLARELAPLTAADISGLARYEIAGRVNTGSLGSGSAVVTGYTEPLPPATGMGARIRQLSAERYGRDPRQIEQELRHRSSTGTHENHEAGGGYGRTGRAA